MKKTIVLALTLLSLSAQAFDFGSPRGGGFDRGRGGNDWRDDRGRGRGGNDWRDDRGRGRGGGDWRDDRGRGNGPGWDDRGRGGSETTYRWEDAGTYKLPKAMEQEIVVNARGAYLNEIALRAQGRIQITSAYAQLSDGRTIDLRITGMISEGREARTYLDRWAVRVERVIIRGTSPDLIGSRGQVQVLLGLAR